MVMKDTLFCLLLGAVIALSLNPRPTEAVCDQTQSAKEHARPLPDVFGDKFKAFSVQYQMNFISKKVIIWGEEYFDETQNKAFMTYTGLNGRYDYILNYADGYIAETATNGSSSICTIIPLESTKSDNFHFFGKINASGGGVRPFPINQVFDMGQPKKFIYQDKTVVIDGVETEHWTACLSWPDDGDVFTLDYYFHMKDATHAYPVQAEVNGEKTLGDGSTRSIHMLYEYFNFVPAANLDPGVFDIPRTIKCSDPQNLVTKNIPTLPSNYKLSYQTEIISKSSNTVTTKDIIYDPVNKVTVTRQGKVGLIDDFQANVHYELTLSGTRGEISCQTLKITPGLFNSAKTGSGLRQKTPDELLSIDDRDTYQYYGTNNDRSIRADIWKRGDKIITYKFQTQADTTHLPLSIISTDSRTNVLDFEFNRTHTVGKGDPFDITACHSESDIKSIRITFVTSDASFNTNALLAEYVVYQLHEIVQTKLANSLGISPLHIHWTQAFVSEQDSELYWDAVLVGPDVKEIPTFPFKNVSQIYNDLKKLVEAQTLGISASTNLHSSQNLIAVRIDDLSTLYSTAVSQSGPLSKFTKYAKKASSNNDYLVKKTATTADNCASLCINEETFECRSFSFCSSTKECLQSKTFYTVSSYDRTSDCDIYSRSFIADFNQQPGYVLKPLDAVLYENIGNDDGCAYMCLHETTINCKSFDYCPESGQCYVAKQRNLERVENDATDKPVCQHYARHTIADYSVSVNTAVVSIDGKHPLQRDGGESPEACALACSLKSSADGCGQFDYCPAAKECHFVSDSVSPYARVVNDALCTTYTSKSASAKQSSLKSTSPDNSTSYGGGSMAALGIIMALIGVALGSVSFFFVSRRQGWTVRN